MNAPAINPAEPGDKFLFVGDREVKVLAVEAGKATYVWDDGPVRENPDNKKKERPVFVVRAGVFEDRSLAVPV